VLRNPLTFPAKPAISAEAQDLISKLLAKDPAQRLGTQVRGNVDISQTLLGLLGLDVAWWCWGGGGAGGAPPPGAGDAFVVFESGA
jgi:hypothetical protein